MNKTEYVIGTTGHRDIHADAIESTRSEIRGALNELQGLLPNTPLRLVSGMADGADRIIVEEALASGIKVDAVLPMPLEMYLDDFSESSAIELKNLLGHPDITTEEIPLPNDDSPSTFTGAARDQLYVRLACVLSRRCSLLIAIWDGIDTGLPGGTSDTLLNFTKVPSRGSGDPVQFRTLAELTHHGRSSDFAIWIPAKRNDSVPMPRIGRAYLTGISGRIVIDDNLPGELIKRISELDEYNATFDERVKAGDLPSPYGLMDAVPENVDPNDLRALQRIESEFVKADTMAIYYQRYSDRLFAGFAMAAGLMGFLFLVYAKILASNFFLFGYLGMFIGGFFAFKLAHSKHWFSKHLMYRLISETMRTRFYLSLAGLGEGKHVRSFEKMTGINQFSGFDWISDVFKFVEPTAPQLISMDNQAGKERLGKIQEAWIDDQCAYFSRKNHQLTEHHHLMEKVKTGLIGFLLIGTALLIVIKPLLVSTVLVGDLHLKTMIVFLMGFLPLCFGVWEIYSGKMAMKELAWQYRQQLDLFADVRERLTVEPDAKIRQDIIGELALDSLRETFLWTMQRYHREHEPPTAG